MVSRKAWPALIFAFAAGCASEPRSARVREAAPVEPRGPRTFGAVAASDEAPSAASIARPASGTVATVADAGPPRARARRFRTSWAPSGAFLKRALFEQGGVLAARDDSPYWKGPGGLAGQGPTGERTDVRAPGEGRAPEPPWYARGLDGLVGDALASESTPVFILGLFGNVLLGALGGRCDLVERVIDPILDRAFHVTARRALRERLYAAEEGAPPPADPPDAYAELLRAEGREPRTPPPPATAGP